MTAGFGIPNVKQNRMKRMDYSRMGGGKSGSNKPRHKERGTDKAPFAKKPVKTELLERMKKAAEKKT